MLNNKKQLMATLGTVALFVMGVSLTNTVYAADWEDAIVRVQAELEAQLDDEARVRARIDNQLSDRVNSESTRAQNAENALDDKIDATKEDLEEQLDDEARVRARIDNQLSDRINNESTRAQNAENALDDKIDATKEDLEEQLDDEARVRARIDNQLSDRINNESTRAQNAENGLKDSIGDHKNIRSANEAINTESQKSLSDGLQAAGNAIGDVNFEKTKYVSKDKDLSSAVRTLDMNLSRVEGELTEKIDRVDAKVNNHHREMRRGFANLAAMTRLVPNDRGCGNTQISAGIGNYHGTTGVAAGVFHYIDDNILVNAAVGYAGHNSTAVGAGVTFGF